MFAYAYDFLAGLVSLVGRYADQVVAGLVSLVVSGIVATVSWALTREERRATEERCDRALEAAAKAEQALAGIAAASESREDRERRDAALRARRNAEALREARAGAAILYSQFRWSSKQVLQLEVHHERGTPTADTAAVRADATVTLDGVTTDLEPLTADAIQPSKREERPYPDFPDIFDRVTVTLTWTSRGCQFRRVTTFVPRGNHAGGGRMPEPEAPGEVEWINKPD